MDSRQERSGEDVSDLWMLLSFKATAQRCQHSNHSGVKHFLVSDLHLWRKVEVESASQRLVLSLTLIRSAIVIVESIDYPCVTRLILLSGWHALLPFLQRFVYIIAGPFSYFMPALNTLPISLDAKQKPGVSYWEALCTISRHGTLIRIIRIRLFSTSN